MRRIEYYMEKEKLELIIEYYEEYLDCPEKHEGAYMSYYSDSHNRYELDVLRRELIQLVYNGYDEPNETIAKQKEIHRIHRSMNRRYKMSPHKSSYSNSKELKKRSNKKVRHIFFIDSGGQYKKYINYE